MKYNEISIQHFDVQKHASYKNSINNKNNLHMKELQYITVNGCNFLEVHFNIFVLN